jgi:hypothetical protein
MAKRLKLTQTILDPVTGEVLHEPGKIVKPGDKLVDLAGPTAFQPVDVEDEPEPKHEPAAPKKSTH